MSAGKPFLTLRARRGASLTEYAVLLGLVACVLVPALIILGDRTERTFRAVFGTPGPLKELGTTASEAPHQGPVQVAGAGSGPHAQRALPKTARRQSKSAAQGISGGAMVYYIDPDGGDDTMGGLAPTSAWKSLGRLRTADLAPGSKVLLKRGGVWRETLMVECSGTPGNPITFGAYGAGDDPVIVGADEVSGFVPLGENLWAARLATEPYQVFFGEERGTRADSRGALDAEREWYWEAGRLYVYCRQDPEAAYGGGGVEATVRDCVFVWGQHDLRFENLRLERGHYGLYAGNTSEVRCVSVAGNWSYYDGLMADGAGCSNIEFVNCTAHHNLRHGIHAHQASNVTVKGGEFYGNAQKYGAGVGLNAVQGGLVCEVNSHDNYYGIKVANEAEDVVVRNNVAHHNASFGIDVDIGPRRVTVEQNHSYGNGSHGICVEWNSSDCVVTRNLVHDNGEQLAGIYVEKVTNVVVSYNVVHDEYIGIGFNESATNCSAYNNVLSNIGGVAIHAFNGCSNITLKNNIAYGCANLAVHVRPDSQAGFVSDYNNWYVDGAKLRWGWQYMTLQQWRQETGRDVHSLCADPQFVSVAGRDFRLQTGSPCVDAGVDVGLEADFDGQPVPQGAAPEMGAFELQDGRKANTPPTAQFTADPTNGAAPLRVRFDASRSYDPDGSIIAYQWDFGDGTTATGVTTRHRYRKPGTYIATLTVQDDGGATALRQMTIAVQEHAKRVIFVADIQMSLVEDEDGTRAYARVAIVDQNGEAVTGATVKGKWSGVVSGVCLASSGNGNTVTLSSRKTRRSGTFTFTVTDVRAEGCLYEPGRNAKASESVRTR